MYLYFLAAAIVLWIVAKWYGDKKHRQGVSEFFNKTLDKQIAERDAAIEEMTKKQSETLEAYYARIAEYNRKHGTNLPDGSSSGTNRP
jgi:hypothetical protein